MKTTIIDTWRKIIKLAKRLVMNRAAWLGACAALASSLMPPTAVGYRGRSLSGARETFNILNLFNKKIDTKEIVYLATNNIMR